jgi:hypothetical protein
VQRGLRQDSRLETEHSGPLRNHCVSASTALSLTSEMISLESLSAPKITGQVSPVQNLFWEATSATQKSWFQKEVNGVEATRTLITIHTPNKIKGKESLRACKSSRVAKREAPYNRSAYRQIEMSTHLRSRCRTPQSAGVVLPDSFTEVPL